MKKFPFYVSLFLIFSLIGCKAVDSSKRKEALKSNYLKGNSIAIENVSDTTFVNLKSVSKDFVVDMKYASEDNFMKQNLYHHLHLSALHFLP